VQGLFSTPQERLQHPNTKSRLCISTSVQYFSENFRCLVATLLERPTNIAELLQQVTPTIGAINAAKDGIGGIHLIPTQDGTMQSILW
jgi:hypothetical protein